MNQELPLEKPEIFEASVASTEASLRTEAHFHTALLPGIDAVHCTRVLNHAVKVNRNWSTAFVECELSSCLGSEVTTMLL